MTLASRQGLKLLDVPIEENDIHCLNDFGFPTGIEGQKHPLENLVGVLFSLEVFSYSVFMSHNLPVCEVAKPT